MESGTPGGKQTAAAADDPGTNLAGALHEVSNALTVIIGWIERARRNETGDGGTGALDMAAGRARQARDIVRRAIGARVPADLPRDLQLVVTDAVLGVEPEARRAGVVLDQRVDAAEAALVLPDCGAVVQILTNLLLNAISMSPRGTTVQVRARRGPDNGAPAVILSVADEGPGVPPERRATLLEAGISTRDGGAGIGLRHAAAMAENAGGTLALVDSARGACFELTWPARDDASDPPSSRIKTLGGALLGTRILVVEDDSAVVDLLEMALSGRGASVVSVRRRADLAGALESGPFDAALFDISPIQDDVPGALRSVRGACPDARLIVMSGSAVALPALPHNCQAAWVRKPFEIDEIVRALLGG